MSNLLEQGCQWLAEQQRKYAAVSVLYQRGDDDVTVLATVGQTVFDVNDGYGSVIKRISRDYLITATELILAGAVTEPQRGDRITETIGGIQCGFEVMGPGGDEPDWRYSDPFRKTLRIHTKQVE